MNKKIILAVAATVALITTSYARGWGHQGNESNGYGQHRGAGYSKHQNSNQGNHGNKGEFRHKRGNHNGNGYGQQSANNDIATLTQEQKDDLNYMYQEEKVARDVYITLGDIWNARVFKNIQKAEQRHMDAVKGLLEQYNLPIPMQDDTIGIFENPELQELYDELVAKGKQSLQDALEVGVAVEETDIADLEAKIVDAPSNITRVYSRLLRGSYNHLKAFNSNLGN